MSLARFVSSWLPRGGRHHQKTRTARRQRLLLEPLEQRNLLATAEPGGPSATGAGLVFANALAGSWSAGYTWVDVQAADLTGNGLDDVVGRIQQTGQWWAAMSNGAGGFTNVPLTAWSTQMTWDNVQTADLNGDGRDAIIGRAQQSGQWWALVSSGAGYTNQLLTTWSPAVTWTDVNVGDLNGDGKADIVGRVAQTGQWWASVSTGSGFKTSLWDQWSPGVTWADVQIGDLTGNGRDDLVGLDSQTGQWYAAISTGAAFQTSLWGSWATSVTWVNVMLADVNGDGKADLIGRVQQTGQWWVGESTGTSFANSLWGTWSTTATWVDVQVADFTGDGRMDIAGRVAQSGQWWVAVSNGSQFNTNLWTTWSPQVTWEDVHAANVTVNSKADLVGMVAGSGQWWVGLSEAPTDPSTGVIGDMWLKDVAQTAAESGDAGAAATYGKHIEFDAQNRVGLNVQVTAPQFVNSVKSDLQSLGMNITAVNYVTAAITGYLSPSKINSLSGLLHFSTATVNDVPIQRAGQVPDQVSPVILANTFQSTTGDDGTGQTVGVISDSANQYNGGLAASYAVGALNPTQVNDLSDPALPGASDEGRAMMELAHDVAPGANLDFYAAGGSPATMATAITSLAAAGAQQIADDIGFNDEPYFNDGILAQAVNQVASQGVFYTSAAGNQGNEAFTAPWSGTAGTIGTGPTSVSGTFFNFGFGAGNILQDFTLPAGGIADFDLQWDSAFLEGGTSALPNFQVPNDLFVYITDPTGSTVYQAFNSTGTNEAWQDAYFVNATANTNFALAIQLASGPAPNVVKWINQSETNDPLAVGEGAPTVYGHPEATGAVATGAVNYLTPTTTESYSALGGSLPIYFDVTGNRLATPELRQKPDLVAPDNVDVSFNIGGSQADTDGDGWPNFQGTSATAPEVAAGAALVRQEVPTETNTQLTQYFQSTAKVIGVSPFDPSSGAGLLQMIPVSPVSPPPVSPPPVSPPPVSPPPPSSPPPVVVAGPPNDQFEPNDTSDTATNFGILTGAQAYTGLTINEHVVNGVTVFDQDWYRWTAGTSGTFTSTVSNIQANGGDFWERVFAMLPNGSLQLVGSSTLTGGVSTQSVSVNVTTGEQLFVWVFGYDFALGSYDLNVGLQ